MPGVIRLQTEIPGPNSRALLARRAKAVPRGVPAVTPLAVVHAEGAVLTDADGNRLIDFGGGIGVVNTGHRTPASSKRSGAQLDRFAHVCFPVSTYEPYVELAERLNRLTPGTHEKRTFFVNSGAEAVENAVKVARYFTGRQAVVCFDHGFHGRTNLTMALTAKVMPYKKGFGPFAPEVYRIPYPYCYRCAEGPSGGRCCLADTARLEQILSTTVDPGSVAAVIMELELGEGGFVPAPVEYVQTLAAFAKQHGILFIADEIQTGFGRTGKLFASRALRPGARPDDDRQVAGGRAAARRRHRPSRRHGGAARRAGSAAPTAGIRSPAPRRWRCSTPWRRSGFRRTPSAPATGSRRGSGSGPNSSTCIGDIRGLGAMVGLELVTDRESRTPDKALTGRVLAAALERGLVLLSAGTFSNTIRVLAPLTADDAIIDEGLDVMGAALEAAVGRTPALA